MRHRDDAGRPRRPPWRQGSSWPGCCEDPWRRVVGLLDRPSARWRSARRSSGRSVRVRRCNTDGRLRTRCGHYSAAPASKSIATSCLVVLPRTIESSTTTTRFPATSSSRLNSAGFSLLAGCPLVGLDERSLAWQLVAVWPSLNRDVPGSERSRRQRAIPESGDRKPSQRREGFLCQPLAHAQAGSVGLNQPGVIQS